MSELEQKIDLYKGRLREFISDFDAVMQVLEKNVSRKTFFASNFLQIQNNNIQKEFLEKVILYLDLSNNYAWCFNNNNERSNNDPVYKIISPNIEKLNENLEFEMRFPKGNTFFRNEEYKNSPMYHIPEMKFTEAHSRVKDSLDLYKTTMNYFIKSKNADAA